MATNNNLLGDLLQEESEFGSKDTPASNNPTKSFDAANSKETNVSVPGGLSEKPTAKPYDGEFGPSPSGLSEKPGSGWPEVSIPVPSSEVLKDETYNKAVGMLQKSFESAGLALKVMKERADQLGGGNVQSSQEAYTEAMLCEAMVTALEDGPYFESLQRDDKEQVKALVKKMRGKLLKLNAGGIKFYKPAKWIRMVTFTGAQVGDDSANDKPANRDWFNTRMWSIVGAVLIEKGSAQEFVKELNAQFKSELGEYKFLMVKMPMTLADAFRVKFGWKNAKQSYFILIDRKITNEIKQAIAAMKAADEAASKPVEESAKSCDDCKDEKKEDKKEEKKDAKGDATEEDDVKTEAAIDDFFGEGVKEKLQDAGKAVKGAANATKEAVQKAMSASGQKVAAAYKKYKAAKDNKDFNAVRSAKDDVKQVVDQYTHKAVTTCHTAPWATGDDAEKDANAEKFYTLLYDIIKSSAELKESYKLAGYDLEKMTAEQFAKRAVRESKA